MIGLKPETLRARIEEAALQLADADDSARECWHLFGKDAPETRDAQRRRRETRDRIAGFGRSLRRRIEQEEEQRQRAEAREDQAEREKWAGV